jgi:hypothetical protein
MKWVGPQIFELSIIFAIDICAYALLLMSSESSFADGLKVDADITISGSDNNVMAQCRRG